MKNFKSMTSSRSSRFYFYFMQFLKLLWNRYRYVPWTSTVLVLICWGLHAVNRAPTSCYFSWKHCWLVFSYHGELSCFQVSKYIKYSTYTGCISLCIYIVWHVQFPENISYFRKTSQVSQFPAKSPDSRNKFVFLPKRPLLELSAPIKNVRSSPSHEIQSTPPGIKASHLVFFYWFSFDEIGLTAQFFVGVNKA